MQKRAVERINRSINLIAKNNIKKPERFRLIISLTVPDLFLILLLILILILILLQN